MAPEDLHNFASDRPIIKLDDDLLGRANFAISLANAMASWHGNDSLVIALHGDWGAGKSSIKNMALSQLESISDNKPDVVEFSPWEWAAQDKITSSFFEEISKSIGRKDKSKSGKKLAAILKKYGRYLNTGETVASSFSAALPTLFILVTLTGFSHIFFNADWIKEVSAGLLIILSSVAAILKWGGDLLNKLGGHIEDGVKGNEQDLSDIRHELTRLLIKREAPLIVVMDDLDRLTSSQVRMVFQLIKANLEFPNVVFLLLFQRDLVEDKMNDGLQLGRDYLEKIIQVPFDIPKVESAQLHKLLFNQLDNLLNKNKMAEDMFDSGRWGNIFHGALREYFDNLRNIYRYISTLSFHFMLHNGKTAFEVNPVDLISIECLRLFEPDVYKEISRSKEILTKNGSSYSNDNRKIVDDLINRILERSSKDKKEIVEEIIKQLFPTIEWVMGRMHYSNEFANTWLREMRVCHPSNFDKYFQFSIPDGEVSNSDLTEMLKLTADSNEFSYFALSLQKRGILKNALSQFESFTNDIPLENGKCYIKGLLDIGDEIDHESEGFTMFSTHTYAIRLVIWFLKRIDNLEERGNLLLECFKHTNGMSIIESILVSDGNRREKSDSNLILSDVAFEKLKLEFVEKLKIMSINTPEKLLCHRHLVSFLYRWKSWGKESDVIEWITLHTQSAKGCIKILEGFVDRSSSHVIGDHVAKVNIFINLDKLERFLDINSVNEKVLGIDVNNLNPKAREALMAYQDALEKREKGIIDYD